VKFDNGGPKQKGLSEINFDLYRSNTRHEARMEICLLSEKQLFVQNNWYITYVIDTINIYKFYSKRSSAW